MSPTSPWYEWHPDSIGWLKRRMRNGEQAVGEDVARIVALSTDVVADPVLRDLVVRACRGELRPRQGRRRGLLRFHKLIWARALVEELSERFTQRKLRWKIDGVTRPRGDASPTERAQQVVARLLGFNSAEVLRNALSSQKKELIAVRARYPVG